METLPRIVNNLTKVAAPTGFESWMIVKRGSFEIIGDLGFKGYNAEGENVDIGYGIVKAERQKGYAAEAVTELMKWAFSQEIVKEITACCLPSNASSMGLLRKLNFNEIKREDEMVYWSIRRQPA
jgi:ribosomal-protein-alanine N-acetyltransferase